MSGVWVGLPLGRLGWAGTRRKLLYLCIAMGKKPSGTKMEFLVSTLQNKTVSKAVACEAGFLHGIA